MKHPNGFSLKRKGAPIYRVSAKRSKRCMDHVDTEFFIPRIENESQACLFIQCGSLELREVYEYAMKRCSVNKWLSESELVQLKDAVEALESIVMEWARS